MKLTRGNLLGIKYDKGSIDTIIDGIEIVIVDEILKGSINCVGLEYPRSSFINCESIAKPIKLTKQILKLSEFKYNSDNLTYESPYQYDGGFRYIEIMLCDIGYYVILSDRTDKNNIKRLNIGHYEYVHILQNLWSTITQTELVILNRKS